MKKRTKSRRFLSILALELCIVAAALLLGLLARRQTLIKLGLTAEKPDFSTESITITYVYKGTFPEDGSLGENWSCGAQLTDPAAIEALCKQLSHTLWDQTSADSAKAPYWRLELDDAVVTLCRPSQRGWPSGYRMIYEHGGEKTVWGLQEGRMQALSDAIANLVTAPDAQMLQQVHIKRVSDGAEFDLTGAQLDAARELMQNVLQHTRCKKTELGTQSTHEVTFTLSDGSVLRLLYYPGGAMRANWSKKDVRGPMGFFLLEEQYDAFPALFESLEDAP